MKTRNALWKSIAVATLVVCSLPAIAARIKHPPSDAPLPVSESAQLKAVVATLLGDNDAFVKSRDEAYFRPLATGQAPRATVVTCSDSQVQTHAFDRTPDGDLFVVRNFGNQLATDQGSVEYGVRRLHTPLLIFIGHSACGAIKAASGNLRRESAAIRRELATIRIPKGVAVMAGVRRNVDNQVAAAIKKFRTEVRQGDLAIVGAVYDFSNELGRGYGRLDIVNINGETDAARIAASRLTDVAFKPAATEKTPHAEPSAIKEMAPMRQPDGAAMGSAAYAYP